MPAVMDIHKWVESAVQKLREVDGNIKAIAIFGSCVYAPELANDIDMLIVTEHKLDSKRYMDSLTELPIDVDLVINEMGEALGDGLKLGVWAFGRLVFGDARFVEEVLGQVPIPSYDDARLRFQHADAYMQMAKSASEEVRHGFYRDAFNALFDAARMAVMTFLRTEATRWGELKQQLPPEFAERFREIINQLHVDYFYRFGYSLEGVEDEYQRWRAEVSAFIDDLEKADTTWEG